jgi:undecaprenyl diphosphate synthase
VRPGVPDSTAPALPVTDVPRHVAVIMDGNGRWARSRRLPRQAGHRAGIRPVRETVEHSARRGVEILTLFAFSSENWRRPPAEVSGLMTLFLEALDREIAELDANGVRLTFIGDRPSLNPRLQSRLTAAEERTAGNSRLQLVVAAAYGGRWDIAMAARRIAEEVAAGRLAPEAVDEDTVARYRALAGLPPVDLLIRTGGEQRISNFLLWDLAYSELFFSDRLWPDFDTRAYDEALAFFAGRQRRFGLTAEQVASC